jgi:hypothetical protein
MNTKIITATNTVLAEILREAANIIEASTEVIDVDQAIALSVVKLAEQTGQIEVLRSAVTEH